MRTQIYINFHNQGNVAIDAVELPEVVNISSSDSLIDNNFVGSKGFQLSAVRDERISTLDGSFGFYTQQKYRGIVTRELSRGDGIFTNVPYVLLNIQGADINKLYVVFDRACNEYATSISVYVDDVLLGNYSNNDVRATLDLSSTVFDPLRAYKLKIMFDCWSAPFASAKVTSISNQYNDIFLGNSIKSFECSENMFNSFTSVSPGIVSQYADILLYDRYGQLRQMAAEGLLGFDADVEIVAVDDKNQSLLLGSFVVEDWEVTATKSTVTITCTDPSVNFDKIRIENIPVQDRTIDQMLSLLFSYVGNFTWSYADWDTEYMCTHVITPDNWFKSDNLRNLLNKVCTLGMLRIYWTNKIFVVARCW